MKAKTKIHSIQGSEADQAFSQPMETRLPSPGKLGPNEQVVEKILSKAERPLSAYDIIPLMTNETGTHTAPATVYRSLQRLQDHGIVTRIESRNAYMMCRHPGEDHECLFFICRQCGKASEAPDSRISELIRLEAQILRFGVKKQVMEIIGLCRNCSGA